MSEDKPLEQIESFNSNFKKLIPIFVENNKKLIGTSQDELELFTYVRIYGSLDNPLYHLGDVGKILDIKKPVFETNGFDDDERIRMNIVSNQKTKKKYLLTQQGLYRLTLQTNTSIGKLFRKCITFILDTLSTNKIVSMSEVDEHIKRNHMDLYNETVKTLRNKIRTLIQERDNLKYKLAFVELREERAINETESMREELFDSKNETFNINRKLQQVQKDYESLKEEVNLSPDYLQQEEVKKIQHKYMKHIYVYLEEIPKSVNCTKSGIDKYNFEMYNINIKPNEFDRMIFSLYPRKTIRKSCVLVYILYASNSNIVNNFIGEMKKIYTDEFIGIGIVCSLDNIISEFKEYCYLKL